MRIDRVGTSNASLTPASRAGAAASAPSSSSITAAEAIRQALAEEELQGRTGAGVGGGQTPKKRPLSSIDDIAARASLNIEERKKVGEKQPGERDPGQEPKDDG